MPTRTIKFIGYTSEETNATFSFNETEVFNGTIPMTGTETSPVALFEFDIDQSLSGSIASSLSVSSGNLVFVTLASNYSTLPNSDTTEADIPNVFTWFNGGHGKSAVKTNVRINDTIFDRTDIGSSEGAGHIAVTNGDTLTCDIVTEAAASQ